MYKTIFKYLEDTALKCPKKIAFCDSTREINYKEFVKESKEIANFIINKQIFNQPIAIYLDKNISTLKCMMGINYSGNYYTNIDKSVKLKDNVRISNKEIVLNNMKHYNDTYFKNIVFKDINRCKKKIK